MNNAGLLIRGIFFNKQNKLYFKEKKTNRVNINFNNKTVNKFNALSAINQPTVNVHPFYQNTKKHKPGVQ